MGLFSKKFEGTFRQHLIYMRMKYEKKPIQHRDLPQPECFRCRPEDELNRVFREKDRVYQNGKIYYAALVQANSYLYEPTPTGDYPACFIYSTNPIMEEYPQLLVNVANDIFSYKGRPLSEVPDTLKKVVECTTDEIDRTCVDFNISIKNPGNPNEIIKDVDIHFCNVMVFRKDLPHGMLEGQIYPVLAAPAYSSVVLILPKKYWSTSIF